MNMNDKKAAGKRIPTDVIAFTVPTETKSMQQKFAPSQVRNVPISTSMGGNQVRFKTTGDKLKQPLNSYESFLIPAAANPDKGRDRAKTKSAPPESGNPLRRYDS